MGMDQDDVVLAPYTTVMKRLLSQTYQSGVFASALTEDLTDKAVDEITAVFRREHKLKEAGAYASAVEAMYGLSQHGEVHLLFLDIQMPELNGLEYSKMVSPDTRIVFTTAFNQYAVDSYKVNALDYLMKPISYVDSGDG